MEHRYIITGINRLTGLRDQLTGPMDEESARARLQRELDSRKHQRYQPYTRLRVEHYDAVQLTLQFSSEDI